jgi:cyanate permease
MMQGTKGRDWANVVLALCVFVSPWVVGFVADATPSWNAWIVGFMLGALAVATISAFAEWEEWVDLALGLWLAASPWLLGFTANVNAMWTSVVLGLAVAAVSLWAVWDIHHPHAHA